MQPEVSVTDLSIWVSVVTFVLLTGYGAWSADVRRARGRGLDPPSFREWGVQGGIIGWWFRRGGHQPPGWVTWAAGSELPAWARTEAPVPPAMPSSPPVAEPPSATPVPTALRPEASAATAVAAPPPEVATTTTVASPGGATSTGSATKVSGSVAPPAAHLPSWVLSTLQATLGERYGDWSLLGAGGMGVVVRGVDRKLHRVVAVKLPPPQLAAQPQFRDRFLREARAQARLTHAAIGRVLDVPDVPPGEIPVLVLEFLEGEDLAARLERLGPEPVGEVRARVEEAAAGLAHAHARGVLHRDVKPSNLMLVEGAVRLLDFGLAAVEGSDKLTTTGMVMGSLPYMPPEQLRGEEVDAAADQFSLAVTAFELLTATLPFGPEDRDRGRPQDAAAVRPEVPAELAAALRRGMAAEPGDRFPDLEAFRQAIRAAG